METLVMSQQGGKATVPSVGLGPAASASPGNWLEMQIYKAQTTLGKARWFLF